MFKRPRNDTECLLINKKDDIKTYTYQSLVVFKCVNDPKNLFY